MKELFIKSTIATLWHLFWRLKALQTYSHTGSSLMLKNVEAISDPNRHHIIIMPKDYETEEGCILQRLQGM